ncbi:Protein CBR-EXC-9 [Caenorhabditis briggsae]|uniref:Protein CBR-EXC-9 n=1 Tax=Caenorhabditis briggsae TaxID=6238 RepID=A8XRG4_CAEBR|nr:Protein CBR-EXC-9 [Caenorhabditis briggsae]CAP35238.2 Protein CBR-EXC-9 [Caenorhabditis briggsae]
MPNCPRCQKPVYFERGKAILQPLLRSNVWTTWIRSWRCRIAHFPSRTDDWTGWHELIAYGIILNVFGAALLLIKAQLDKDVIKAAVDQKFRDAGIRVNSTDGTDEEEEITEPSAVLLVMITMGGRMANVVGTMKLYKGLGKYLSDRKRKKFQSTTERIQNGEAETECTELLADCCQVC